MLEQMRQLISSAALLPPDSHVLCAVSGGADSVCLLHALYHLRPSLNFSLSAAHYDHGLRGEDSTQDAGFVEQFVSLCCGEQRLPDGRVLPPVKLYQGKGDVGKEAARTGAGIEETARILRYAFLRRAAQQAGANLIATAHTADDNAETILFHLSRGSGLRGLTGIAPRRDGLIRPLLTTTRHEIEDYLRYYALPHREDRTNFDDTYARNRIRHQVVPVLDGLFPGFSPRMSQVAARLRADEDYLSDQARAVSGQAVRRDGGLVIPAAALAQAPGPLAVRALRQLLDALCGGDWTGSAVHLESVLALCRTVGPSTQISMPHGLVARREYDDLVLAPAAQETLPICPLPLPGTIRAGPWTVEVTGALYRGEMQTPFDLWLAQSEALLPLTLRPRQTGDRLRLPGRPEKTVKKWLIDEKIPRSRRDLLPVLAAPSGIAAVAGLGAAAEHIPKPGQAAWHIRFIHANRLNPSVIPCGDDS